MRRQPVQLAAQLSAALHVQGLGDRLVAQHIMGSPANSIRTGAEICTGDYHWASQLLTRAASGAWVSFEVLGRLACCWARWCARQTRY